MFRKHSSVFACLALVYLTRVFLVCCLPSGERQDWGSVGDNGHFSAEDQSANQAGTSFGYSPSHDYPTRSAARPDALLASGRPYAATWTDPQDPGFTRPIFLSDPFLSTSLQTGQASSDVNAFAIPLLTNPENADEEAFPISRYSQALVHPDSRLKDALKHMDSDPRRTDAATTTILTGNLDRPFPILESGAVGADHHAKLPSTSEQSDTVSASSHGLHTNQFKPGNLPAYRPRPFFDEPQVLKELESSPSRFKAAKGTRYKDTGEDERSTINREVFDGKLEWVRLPRSHHQRATALGTTRVLPFVTVPDPNGEGMTRMVRMAVHGGSHAGKSAFKEEHPLYRKTYWTFFSLPETQHSGQSTEIVQWHGVGFLDRNHYKHACRDRTCKAAHQGKPSEITVPSSISHRCFHSSGLLNLF
ncbi:related to effector family protein Eff1 [Sporisorium reilianum f. sp. reilianum]|uniref:Related to effector family protein Eff1 n=1 Tax=Sporisorium reilianum f. sp. reilianum TaxID=72559 RepID=A0A2N8UBY3_9BASI|nr:related to effector family protein Eff1 [Sporisorium reilianum f. sp. reilianum]